MINKIKKKIGEIFGKKDVDINKKDTVVRVTSERETQKEEVKKDTHVKVDMNRDKRDITKTFESKRMGVEGYKTGDRDRNSHGKKNQNNRTKERGENTRRYNESTSRGKERIRRDNQGKKNFNDRKTSESFNKRVTKEEKLNNWIEQGFRALTEGRVLNYEDHSITIIKKNTLGFEANIDNSRVFKITFNELVTDLRGLKGAQDIKGELSSEESDKNLIIRGIFQKK